MEWWGTDVRFVLDQHAELGFCSASSLKQQYEHRHVDPFGHIIFIPNPLGFALTPICCVLSEETANTNFIVFGLNRPGFEPMWGEHENHNSIDVVYLILTVHESNPINKKK